MLVENVIVIVQKKNSYLLITSMARVTLFVLVPWAQIPKWKFRWLLHTQQVDLQERNPELRKPQIFEGAASKLSKLYHTWWYVLCWTENKSTLFPGEWSISSVVQGSLLYEHPWKELCNKTLSVPLLRRYVEMGETQGELSFLIRNSSFCTVLISLQFKYIFKYLYRYML